jgi:hypothetical protein
MRLVGVSSHFIYLEDARNHKPKKKNVFTASGITHVSCCRPATTHVYNTKGCKYSLDAPDDERKYRSKHVEQSRNTKLSYTVASCWSFSYIVWKYVLWNILRMLLL